VCFRTFTGFSESVIVISGTTTNASWGSIGVSPVLGVLGVQGVLGVLVVEVDIMVGATMMVTRIMTRGQKEKKREYEVIG
jgi:hypothetical protein